MQITIREPGSAITHFIAMMLTVFAAAPLLVKSALSDTANMLPAMTIFILSMVLLYGASATYHSLNIGGRALRIFRKVDHMMILHTGLSDCPWWKDGLHTFCRSMGDCHCRHAVKSLLGHLSQMVFFYYIYCHGLGLCFRVWSFMEYIAPQCFSLASGRRDHLYNRRCDLRAEAPTV